MLDFEIAPYLELKDYKAPKGVKSYFVNMNDGKKIRLIYWKKKTYSNDIRGTILLQQGHNEFVEKYYETIQEFLDRNFNVVCFDWRGQGLSDRMINEHNKQFIEDFDIHDNDLDYIINSIIKVNFPKPLIGIGHSMGGCILLSSLFLKQNNFDAMILSAPMLGFKNEKILMYLLPILNLFYNKKSFFPFSKPNMGDEIPFQNNDLTKDELRYKRTQKLVKLNPKIRLWGITITWVNAVKKRLNLIRKESLNTKINIKLLIFNSINDRVVDSKKTNEIAKRLNNCNLINLFDIEHEIFMERDIHRKKMWDEIDKFLKNY